MESQNRPNRLTLTSTSRKTARSAPARSEGPSLCSAEHIPLSFRVRCAIWNSKPPG